MLATSITQTMLPDWQLPTGVDRGLWDYLQSEPMARTYDEKLTGTPLLQVDLRFAEKHFATAGSLIDLGCGTGRLLAAFARRGFTCVGVDLSETMLEIAAAKARREGLAIRYVKANLVELDGIADSAFDCAACLFSTLGMIRGTENRRRFLRHVARLLRPGGVFVLHVHNRWFRLGRGLGNAGKEKGDRTMPQAYGGADLTLHHFSRREIVNELLIAGFGIRSLEPVGLRFDGRLPAPWWAPSIRAYGYLIAATNEQSTYRQACVLSRTGAK